MDDVTRYSADDDFDDDFDIDVDENQDDDSDNSVGVLGEYRLIELIGAGGMGRVFRAEHRTMHREVALKVLSGEIAQRKDLLQQFFSEIRAVAKLMHPNIVTAFDAGSFGEIHYLVMELVEGDILSGHVRQAGPMSSEDAVNVLEQAARALTYAHELGIVHRDIKPSNMMLTQEGVLKILDFGLARLGVAQPEKQSSKVLMGTPEYMSPEQIENPDQVDGRSDLYSLGATLFYLLTGKPMFSGEHLQVARAQLRQKPTPLFVERSNIDLRLDAVFQKLVAKDPGQRYANASELLTNLEALNLASDSGTKSTLSKGSFRLAAESPTSIAYDKSTLAKKSQIVAIDLGLIASTAAVYDATLGPQIVPQGEGSARHIRNMLWSHGEQVKVGPDAIAMRQTEPESVFHSIQRWIGVDKIARSFAGKNVPPEVMIGMLLRKIMQNAASMTDGSSSAVVTVPSCYDQLHRRAIRNACRIAGIELVQLIDKPVAAALSWLDVHARLSTTGSQDGVSTSRLLVVHLGGTGLEASVIQIQGNTAQQLGACGHWKLGVQRWQHLLAEYFAGTLKQQTGKNIRDDVAGATRLQRTVEMAMDRLASTSRVDVKFEWEGATIEQRVTQDGLVKIAPELTSALQQSVTSACTIAKTDLSEVDQVLFIGSMMQMKSVQQIVRNLIPHNVNIAVLEKSEVARGAAIQAQHLSSLSTQDALTPKALGCTTNDFALLASSSEKAKPRKLLEKATPIPASHSRTIRPQEVDGRFRMPRLQMIESTSLGAGNWLRLGNIDPNEVFPLRQPDDPLQLRMEVDENGILESSLIWPAQNRQVAIPASSDHEISLADTSVWREWLETIMLCSDS